jgi:hypothetical protein
MLDPYPTSTTQYMNIVAPLTGVGTTHQSCRVFQRFLHHINCSIQMQPVPHIESRTSNYESPPPYEVFHNDDLASSTFTARERAVVPLPPLSSSPLRSPTLRFTAALGAEGDEVSTAAPVVVSRFRQHYG